MKCVVITHDFLCIYINFWWKAVLQIILYTIKKKAILLCKERCISFYITLFVSDCFFKWCKIEYAKSCWIDLAYASTNNGATESTNITLNNIIPILCSRYCIWHSEQKLKNHTYWATLTTSNLPNVEEIIYGKRIFTVLIFSHNS